MNVCLFVEANTKKNTRHHKQCYWEQNVEKKICYNLLMVASMPLNEISIYLNVFFVVIPISPPTLHCGLNDSYLQSKFIYLAEKLVIFVREIKKCMALAYECTFCIRL